MIDKAFQVTFSTLAAETHLTQEEIAELLDTTQATVSRWMAGLNRPTRHTRASIYQRLAESMFV